MDLKERGADVLPPYNHVDAEKKKCLPSKGENMISRKDGEVIIPMADVVHHQIEGICDSDIRARMHEYNKDKNNRITFYHKYGGDSAGTNAQYRSKIDQSHIFASYTTSLAIKVENKVSKKSKYFYVNYAANSETSVAYLRLCYERETNGMFHY